MYAHESLSFLKKGHKKPFETSLGAGHRETELLALSRETSKTEGPRVARIFVNRLKEAQVYHFHDTSEEAQIRNSQDVDRNLGLLSQGGNLAAFLYSLQQTRPAHYRVILSAFQSIVPYVQELVLRPDVLDPTRILLRWRDRNLNHELGGHQLSDGSIRALALVTALLQPEETMPGILLLDEPELGLHPSGIALIASLIKSVSTKRQVIVATQSPRFLAEFRPEQVVVVERREDAHGFGESTFTRLDPHELKGWLEDYDLGALYEMQVTGGSPR